MFQVFDNGKPADRVGCKVHDSWNKSSYDTLEEAREYVKMWLGKTWALSADVVLQVGVPVDYTGFGDYIEIREV